MNKADQMAGEAYLPATLIGRAKLILCGGTLEMTYPMKAGSGKTGKKEKDGFRAIFFVGVTLALRSNKC
jgi:hypothetical protein